MLLDFNQRKHKSYVELTCQHMMLGNPPYVFYFYFYFFMLMLSAKGNFRGLTLPHSSSTLHQSTWVHNQIDTSPDTLCTSSLATYTGGRGIVSSHNQINLQFMELQVETLRVAMDQVPASWSTRTAYPSSLAFDILPYHYSTHPSGVLKVHQCDSRSIKAIWANYLLSVYSSSLGDAGESPL